jgi:hypothetical protein
LLSSAVFPDHGRIVRLPWNPPGKRAIIGIRGGSASAVNKLLTMFDAIMMKEIPKREKSQG